MTISMSAGGEITENNNAQRLYLSSILLFLALFTMLFTYNTGLRLGLDKADLGLRYKFQVLPMVLSEFHGKQHDYTAFSNISDFFFNNYLRPANVLINEAKLAFPSSKEETRFIVGDDKGVVDFTWLAFKIFGSEQESLYKLFFFILLISTLVFSLQYFKNTSKMISLLSILLSIYGIGFTFITQQAVSFIEPRVFGVLSIISLFHLFFASTQKKSFSIVRIGCIFFQASIVVFVCHMRFSEIWQILSLVLFFVIYAGQSYLRTTASKTVKLRSFMCMAIPSFALFIFLGILKCYTIFYYHPAYFDHYSTKHVLWHNILIGTAIHPSIQKRHNLIPCNDGLVILAVTSGLKLKEDIFGSRDEHYRNFNFVDYEKAARRFYFQMFMNHPFELLQLYFIMIPKTFITSIGYLATGVATYPDFFYTFETIDVEKRNQESLYYKPFRIEVLSLMLFVAIIAVLVNSKLYMRFEEFKQLLIATFFAGLFSLIPPILTTPTMWYIQPSLVLMTTLLYLIMFLVISYVVQTILKIKKLLLGIKK